MIDLSIIILSYNTSELTINCIQSILKSLNLQPLLAEIIVVDNNSTDKTVDMITPLSAPGSSNNITIKIIKNPKNYGFAKGNNIGARIATGKYLLFLNSDTLIKRIDWHGLMEYCDTVTDFGALTVKVLLPNGKLDLASHRGFPTVWRSFCYFAGFEKIATIFPFMAHIFGGYHLLDKNFNSAHFIDSPSGAFFLTRREIFNTLDGFDENFFMYGEDLDLAYRLKLIGLRIHYYPVMEITHLKYQSGLNNQNRILRSKIKKHFYEAMLLFFHKHYNKAYPKIISNLTEMIIKFKLKTI